MVFESLNLFAKITHTRGQVSRIGRAWLFCALLAVVAGCASSKGRAPVPGMGPDDVFQEDLPAPEAPPIEIRSRLERDPRTGEPTYVYTISNGTPYPITDFHIGMSAKNGSNAIRISPAGMTADGRMPREAYAAPDGWFLQYNASVDGMGRVYGKGYLTWTAHDHTVWIAPGETLTGFRVGVPKPDEIYERSHWVALVHGGEAGTYGGELVRADDGVPSGDSVERLGRLRISPSVSRGDVTIRYSTPRQARPILAILGPGGQVVRSFPQDKSKSREHQIVWDRKDANGSAVAAGDYFVRVRYGFTERYGRVTLLR